MHRTESHRNAPNRTQPHTTPHHTHHATSLHTIPHHTTPHHTATHRTTPHHTTPHHTAPHHTTHHTPLHQITHQYTIHHHTIHQCSCVHRTHLLSPADARAERALLTKVPRKQHGHVHTMRDSMLSSGYSPTDTFSVLRAMFVMPQTPATVLPAWAVFDPEGHGVLTIKEVQAAFRSLWRLVDASGRAGGV